MITGDPTKNPVWSLFQQRFPAVVQLEIQQGRMNPAEWPILQNLVMQMSPHIQQFIQSLTVQYPVILDDQMDNAIRQRILPVLRQQAAQQMAMQANIQRGYGMPVAPGTMGMPYAQGNMAAMYGGGGGGMGGMMMRPAPVTAANMYGGTNGMATPGMFTGQTGGEALFGGGMNGTTPVPTTTGVKDLTQLTKPDQPQQPKPVVQTNVWKRPEMCDTGNITAKLQDGVELRVDRFALSDGTFARRAAVYDPRIRYLSDREAIEAYKSVFAKCKDSEHKFITVFYKQLKVLNVGRQGFEKMANVIRDEVIKNPASTETKLRAIIGVLTSTNAGVGFVNEFTRVFLEELDFHVLCGELCDSAHSTAILGSFDSLQSVLDMLTGELPKETLDALNTISNFRARFTEIVDKVITAMAVDLPKVILNPDKKPGLLSTYIRALPQVWSPDGGNTTRGTDDLNTLFVSTRVTIDSSRTDGAFKAETDLKMRLNELENHFTVISVRRTVSWCDWFKSYICDYSEGKCSPHVFKPNEPDCDVAFFLADVINAADATKAVPIRYTPKTLLCEREEECFTLQYGVTTDGCIWVANARYW